MLTTTYSLIVFAAEQKDTRAKIMLLRDRIRHAVAGASVLDSAFVDGFLTQLNGFHDYLQSRKLDVYLIGRMRALGRHAALLLTELESLSLLIRNALLWTREKMALATRYGGLYLVDLQDAVELYCTSVRKKIDKEEDELLPMATHLLTAEDWFQIAGQLLSQHSKTGVMKADIGVSAPIGSGAANALSGQAKADVITMMPDSCDPAHTVADSARVQCTDLRTLDVSWETNPTERTRLKKCIQGGLAA